MALDAQQIISLGIFIATYLAIMSNRIHRTIAAILGAGIMVALIFPPDRSLELIFRYVNWETLALIFGMFTLVTGLRESGFFRWIGLLSAKAVRYNPVYIFFAFPFLAAFLAMFLDSITVMLFMATLTIEVSAVVGMKPIPLIIVEISAANIGGSATLVGDPPNVIIGTQLGYSFMDFARNTGPAAWISWIVTMLFFYAWHRKSLKSDRRSVLEKMGKNQLHLQEPRSAITDPWLLKVGVIDLCIAVFLLTIHHQVGLTAGQIGLIAASIILAFGGNPQTKTPSFLEKIDWSTILFFGCLFVVVGGIEFTGIIHMAAEAIAEFGGGNLIATIGVILWSSAILSSIIDNVPFAATMAPLIRDLSQISGIDLATLAWSLALGTDIGGNGTPIGASANVVGCAVAEKNNYPISWRTYCSVAYPAMMVSVAVVYVILIVRYAL